MHLAAKSDVDRLITGVAIFLEANIMDTAVMLEALRAYRNTLRTKRLPRCGFRTFPSARYTPRSG